VASRRFTRKSWPSVGNQLDTATTIIAVTASVGRLAK
jgi:hypothetical protein